MDITLLKNFNNYFNRKIIKFDNYTDYTGSYIYKALTGLDFNPNDGVNTEQIFNWSESWTPDYILVTEQVESEGVTSTHILSRWFVMEWQRVRGKQYKATLHRDVISDNYNDLLNAPLFVEKGMVGTTDPMIFNRENMSFNQIKKSEVELKDASNVPWVVGYIASNASKEDLYTKEVTLSSSGTYSGTYSSSSIRGLGECYVMQGNYRFDAGTSSFTVTYSDSNHTISYSINLPGAASSKATIYLNYKVKTEVQAVEKQVIEGAIPSTDLPWDFHPDATSVANISKISIMPRIFNKTNGSTNYSVFLNTDLYYNSNMNVFRNRTASDVMVPPILIDTTSDQTNLSLMYTTGGGSWTDYGLSDTLLRAAAGFKFDMQYNTAKSILNNQGVDISANSSVDITYYNNKIISHNGRYYKITVGAYQEEDYSDNITSSSLYLNEYLTCCQNFVHTASALSAPQCDIKFHNVTSTTSCKFYVREYPITVEEVVSDRVISLEIPQDGDRTHLKDAPYDMFCIPYGSVTLHDNIQTSAEAALQIAFEIAKDLGTSKVYDLQLLPFCPCPQYIVSQGVIDETRGTEGSDYAYIVNGNDVVSVVIFCPTSSGTFNIEKEIEMPDDYSEDSSINLKVVNECDMYRLVSPNFNGQFEFNLAMNDGSIDYFNVDYTYKPYSPYIHINPNFKGLYGQDFNDARGLICGGDFSLPIISDAWTNYQIQNKNYQNIFDRQIQNLDVQQNVGKLQDNLNMITAPLTGAAGGAIAGGKVGGPYGAIAGAVVGMGAGIAGSILDANLNQELRNEQRSYSIDMYNYQLGNIKALPYSLSKTSAFTYNNKIFPILEYYSCTDAEKEALIDKLTYNGMTVMKIGKLIDYVGDSENYKFIKGQLIRCDGISDDNHMLYSCYEELNKGVYI